MVKRISQPACEREFTFFANLEILRLALFLCITPLAAALSITFTARWSVSFALSASFDSTEAITALTLVFT